MVLLQLCNYFSNNFYGFVNLKQNDGNNSNNNNNNNNNNNSNNNNDNNNNNNNNNNNSNNNNNNNNNSNNNKIQVYKLWKMKTTSSSGILKTLYHNGNYLLLFGKRELQSFEVSEE